MRSSARWFIGNSTTSRRFSSPHNSITMQVDAERDAAVWGRAERRAQHAAEFLLQRLLAVAGNGERLLHHVRAVVADGAGGQLDAVADDVILELE
jgi:hypothetical protein